MASSRSQSPQEDGISWYHGKITRDAAEHILKISGREEGQFLVRESSTSQGDFVLSLIHRGCPIHYQIRRHGEDAFFSIDEGPIMHGLEVLVTTYQDDAEGLCTKLGPMCRGQPPPPDSRRHGRTNLLHRATKEGELVVVEELLKSGYHSLDAKNQEGQTAVLLASIMGHDQILCALLRGGASANTKDCSGRTPLHYACHRNHPTTVSILLEQGGANIQARDTDSGWVPLHYAASRGHLEVVKLLLKQGAPAKPRSVDGETPLDIARKEHHDACISFLEPYVPPAPKTTRTTWFHETVGREEACQLLHNGDMLDGRFLVRRSSRKPGAHVLTMASAAHIYHYEVQQKEDEFYIDDGPYLNSLEHVVDHYGTLADGLPTILVHPVRPEPSRPSLEDIQNNNKKGFDREGPLNGFNASYLGPNLITKESLLIGAPIGEGEYGSVKKGKWRMPDGTEVKVAIKILHEEHVQNGRENFMREVELMVKLHHPAIVQLLGVSLGPPLAMVQELMSMGSMLDYILDCADEIDVTKDLQLWAAQIAEGMTYLEKKRFIHRDLAARNILLSSKHQVKITDFGLSRALGSGSEYYKATSGGWWPVKWYAPESVNFGNFSHASDVWSYGVTLWEMFSFGLQPYGEMTGAQVMEFLETGARLECPKKCPQSVFQAMLNCWSYQPEKRPTFTELRELFTTLNDGS